MISYFKYSSGNDFTLNGTPYSGFFNVLSGTAYTGRKKDSLSQRLDPQNKFATRIYLNMQEFDTTHGTPVVLNDVNYINRFDVLDKPKFDKMVSDMDSNNLYCFRNIILGHPTIFNSDKNNYSYYGLAASDSPNAQKFTSHPAQFSQPFSGNWDFMNNMAAGCFTVDTQDNFKYFCSDDTNLYILKGNFSTNEDLSLIYKKDFTPEKVYNIYSDMERKELFIVLSTGIDIYDISNFDICENLVLTNRISLTDSLSGSSKPSYVKIGNYFRTHLTNSKILQFRNKYTSDIETFIDLKQYVNGVYDIAIRTIDDFTIVLGVKDGTTYFIMIDPYDLDSVKMYELKNLDASQDSLKIMFSTSDSNVFYITNTDIVQARWVSNPSHMSWGKLEDFVHSESGYSGSYTNTNNTDATQTSVMAKLFVTGNNETCVAKVNDFESIFNLVCIEVPESSLVSDSRPLSSDILFGETRYYQYVPESITTRINGKNYLFFTQNSWDFGDGSPLTNFMWENMTYAQIRSQHTYPPSAGEYYARLSLLNACSRTVISNFLTVKITKSDPLTPTSLSRPFGDGPFDYNLFFNEYSNHGYQYILIHAYGRLFALKQPIQDKYLNGDSMDIDKNFQKTKCSQSSFGAYFNNNVHTVLKDTMTLYSRFPYSFYLKKDGISPKYFDHVPSSGQNLYLNTNETVNVIPIKRIMDNMTEMQKALLPETG